MSPAPRHHLHWLWLLPRLAWHDLCHDWVLTFCTVCGLAAVMAPILVVFGLQQGTVETLRHRLMQDPRNREVTPSGTLDLSSDDFGVLRARPEVAFAVPDTRTLSASIAWAPPDGSLVHLDVRPSGPGDPLLLDNGARPPPALGITLSSEAARILHAGPGTNLNFLVSRIRKGSHEQAPLPLRVESVATERATALPMGFLSAQTLAQIEDFKDGLPVPQLGWTGNRPVPEVRFDGLLVRASTEVGSAEREEVRGDLGLVGMVPLDEKLSVDLGIIPSALGAVESRTFIYWLHSGERSLGPEVIGRVRRRFPLPKYLVDPWLRPIEVALAEPTSEARPLRVHGCASDSRSEESPASAGPFRLEVASGLVPGPAKIRVTGAHGAVELPVLLEAASTADLPTNSALMSVGQLGLLRALERPEVRYTTNRGFEVELERRFASFRLYTHTLEQVAPLAHWLEQRRMPVRTQAERIADVQRLDATLGRIFVLIMAVGAVGGLSALLASLIAAVQRKRQSLGVLRLLGLPARVVAALPVLQAVAVTLAAFALAVAIFAVASTILDRLFQSQLRLGESFVSVRIDQLLAAAGAGAVLAGITALAAARLVMRIDPAEVIRPE